MLVFGGRGVNASPLDDCIYQHFNGPGHNGLDDISVQLIDKGNSERIYWTRRDSGHTDLNA